MRSCQRLTHTVSKTNLKSTNNNAALFFQTNINKIPEMKRPLTNLLFETLSTNPFAIIINYLETISVELLGETELLNSVHQLLRHLSGLYL